MSEKRHEDFSMAPPPGCHQRRASGLEPFRCGCLGVGGVTNHAQVGVLGDAKLLILAVSSQLFFVWLENRKSPAVSTL